MKKNISFVVMLFVGACAQIKSGPVVQDLSLTEGSYLNVKDGQVTDYPLAVVKRTGHTYSMALMIMRLESDRRWHPYSVMLENVRDNSSFYNSDGDVFTINERNDQLVVSIKPHTTSSRFAYNLARVSPARYDVAFGKLMTMKDRVEEIAKFLIRSLLLQPDSSAKSSIAARAARNSTPSVDKTQTPSTTSGSTAPPITMSAPSITFDSSRLKGNADLQKLHDEIAELADRLITANLPDYDANLDKLKADLDRDDAGAGDAAIDWFRSQKTNFTEQVRNERKEYFVATTQSLVEWMRSGNAKLQTLEETYPKIVTYYEQQDAANALYMHDIIVASTDQFNTLPLLAGGAGPVGTGNGEVMAMFFHLPKAMVSPSTFERKRDQIAGYHGKYGSIGFATSVEISGFDNLIHSILNRYFSRHYFMAINSKPVFTKVTDLGKEAIIAHELKHYLDERTRPELYDPSVWAKLRDSIVDKLNASNNESANKTLTGPAYEERRRVVVEMNMQDHPNGVRSKVEEYVDSMFRQNYNAGRGAYGDYFMSPWERSAYSEQCKYLRANGVSSAALLADPETYVMSAGIDAIGSFGIGKFMRPDGKSTNIKVPAAPEIVEYFQKCAEGTL